MFSIAIVGRVTNHVSAWLWMPEKHYWHNAFECRHLFPTRKEAEVAVANLPHPKVVLADVVILDESLIGMSKEIIKILVKSLVDEVKFTLVPEMRPGYRKPYVVKSRGQTIFFMPDDYVATEPKFIGNIPPRTEMPVGTVCNVSSCFRSENGRLTFEGCSPVDKMTPKQFHVMATPLRRTLLPSQLIRDVIKVEPMPEPVPDRKPVPKRGKKPRATKVGTVTMDDISVIRRITPRKKTPEACTYRRTNGKRGKVCGRCKACKKEKR